MCCLFVYCSVFVVCCSLLVFVLRSSFAVVWCLVFGGFVFGVCLGLLFVRSLLVVCCLSFVVRCSLFVVCGLLVVGCVLLVV